MLYRHTTTVAIDTEAQVADYTYGGSTDIIVLIRVDLIGIAGGLIYNLKVACNGSQLAPDSAITVGDGITTAVIQSRNLMLRTGDNLTISLTGGPEDTSVTITVSIADVTPVSSADIVTMVSPELANAVQDAIRDLEVIVKPQRIILGPIPQGVKTFLLPIPQGVSTPLLPERH